MNVVCFFDTNQLRKFVFLLPWTFLRLVCFNSDERNADVIDLIDCWSHNALYLRLEGVVSTRSQQGNRGELWSTQRRCEHSLYTWRYDVLPGVIMHQLNPGTYLIKHNTMWRLLGVLFCSAVLSRQGMCDCTLVSGVISVQASIFNLLVKYSAAKCLLSTDTNNVKSVCYIIIFLLKQICYCGCLLIIFI